MKQKHEESSGDGEIFLVILMAVVIVIAFSGGFKSSGFATPVDDEVLASITPH